MNLRPEVRIFDPARDYGTVSAWWRAHGWDAVPAETLPKLGVVAYFVREGAEPREGGAGFLYMDNSCGVCWLDWLVTNPENRGAESVRCIDTVVDFLRREAVRMGYHTMLTACRQPALVRLMERNDFSKTDDGMTHLVWSKGL